MTDTPSIETVADPTKVLWIMPWSSYKKADGSRQYPDREDEEQFNAELALALLLINEVIFMNDHWWEKGWPEEARAKTSLNVNCSDVFAWGCADAEEIDFRDLESLYRLWIRDPVWGSTVWCIKKRKELPQTPVVKSMREAGWDLAALKSEFDLRENHSNGVSGILADMKREAYVAWCEKEGKKPRFYDSGWWSGWKAYTDAHPGWYTEEWKSEENRRIAEWKSKNGWTIGE